MAYVSQEQYYDICNQRDMIEGSLNRIAITDDIAELNSHAQNLIKRIEKYAECNRDRINGVYKTNDWVNPIDIEL